MTKPAAVPPSADEIEKSQLEEAIGKAMLDSDGKNSKGYFTPSELALQLLMIPDSSWDYNKVRLAIDKLVKENALVELEPRQKYAPTG
jgi:hypothetical protein